MKLRLIVIVLFLFYVVDVNGIKEPLVDQIKQGNFALPGSQQPFPLLGFGQTIVPQYDLLQYTAISLFKGNTVDNLAVDPSILYGIRDDLAIFLTLPIDVSNRNGNMKSSGLSDFSTQLEYALWERAGETFFDRITVAGILTLPTGSAQKNPPTGFGSPTFFIGFTGSHLSVEWYTYMAYGGMFTTKNFCTKLGNQYFYQCGIGKNIPSPKGWIFLVLTEFLGHYIGHNVINSVLDKSSGGNTFLILPSVWISSEHFVLQCGVGTFVAQHLFGNQRKDTYVFATNIGWKLNW